VTAGRFGTFVFWGKPDAQARPKTSP